MRWAYTCEPLAMTCGALAAIYYRWKALSEEERNAIVSKLTAAFEVGAELIKSMLQNPRAL